MSENSAQSTYGELAADIVSAYVSNNSVPLSELPSLIRDVHFRAGPRQRPDRACCNGAVEACGAGQEVDHQRLHHLSGGR